MPKMTCRCDYVFDFTGDTSENELSLFQQTFIEKTAELLDAKELDGDRFFSSCVLASRDVHPCPKCGRIYVEAKPRSGVFDVYVKEDQLSPRSHG